MNVDKEIFTPVKSKRTFEEVSSSIKTMIIEGTLKPGDKLPPESELAKQLKVGRQTIREALRILELSGFISIQKGFGGGPVIKDTILRKVSNLLLDAFKMEKITVNEFIDSRLVIEKAIINKAIDNATDDDIKELQTNLVQAKEKINKKELATDINFEFHSLLAKSSQNNVFIILESAINAIHHTLRVRSNVDLASSKAAMLAHGKILEALINKDREKAIALMDKHVRTVGKTLDLGLK